MVLEDTVQRLARTALARRPRSLNRTFHLYISALKTSLWCGLSARGSFVHLLLGGLTVGSAGCIAAFANVFPRVTTHIYKLHGEGKVGEALALHQKAALAEQATKAGIATIKYAASVFTAPRAGLAGREKLFDPRRPYLPASEDQKKAVHSLMSELNKLEEELGASS